MKRENGMMAHSVTLILGMNPLQASFRHRVSDSATARDSRCLFYFCVRMGPYSPRRDDVIRYEERWEK